MGTKLNNELFKNLGEGYTNIFPDKPRKLKYPYKLAYISNLTKEEKNKLKIQQDGKLKNNLVFFNIYGETFGINLKSISKDIGELIKPDPINCSILSKINSRLFNKEGLKMEKEEGTRLISNYYRSLYLNTIMFRLLFRQQEMIKSIFDSNLDKNHLRVLVELFDLQYKQDPKNLEYSRNKTKRIDRKILLKKVKMKKEIFLKKVKELISKKLISVDSKDYVKYHKEHYRGGPLKVKKKNGLTDKIGFLVFNYKKFNKDYGVKFETIFNTFTNRIHIIDYPLYAPVFPQETISNLKKL